MYLRVDCIPMKVSYHWLKDYLNFDKSPEEVADILTKTGLEVENIEPVGSVKGGLKGVVTGKIQSCEKHPDADKLKLTRVDIGNETLQIVCGASNVAEGQIVLVALVGTTLFPITGEPITLRKAKIRGVESHGMICAEDELGLGTSHEGIMVLPSDTPVGIPAAEALKLDNDFILEIGLTPNRCDAMGHYGVARDLRAYLNHHEALNQALTPFNSPEFAHEPISKVQFEVSNDTGCTAYYAAVIKGVKISTESTPIGQRLEKIGVSSINNVVDCANYVMHEFGTPLHAFDARIFKHKLDVRFAEKGEELVTLDGATRKLTSNDVVIAGDGKAHCLAGVMGGKESGVRMETVDIIVESAIFDPSKIRKTAKLHGIHSDASFRFERGVDPEFTWIALQRAVSLILENAGGTLAGIQQVVQHPAEPGNVTLDFAYINNFLGSHLTDDQIEGILYSLDFKKLGGDLWEIPRYRCDVQRPIDVIEEIIRIAGFESVPLPDKWSFSMPVESKPTPFRFKRDLSLLLSSQGFREIMNNSLTKASYGKLYPSELEDHDIKLLNPLSGDLSVLRRSIVFGALESIAYNQNRQSPNLKLFEFGKTYRQADSKAIEENQLLMAITGVFNAESWLSSNNASFFQLKEMVINVISSYLKDNVVEISFTDEEAFDAGIHLEIRKQRIATLGIISKKWQSHFNIKQPVFAALVAWEKLQEFSNKSQTEFEELPKTFQVRRDFALVLNPSVTYEEIRNEARKAASKRLIKTSLFDVYQGDKIPAGKKSYAVAFHFRDQDKTLTDAEIDEEMEAIRLHLEQKLGATLR